MKKLFVIVSACLVAGFAQAQGSVPSVNAAGYIKVAVEAGKFYFLQNPFNSFDGTTATLDDVIGDALPDGSQVYLWNQNTQKFDTAIYYDGIGWFPALNLERGKGFFVCSPAGAPPADMFLFGEVPGASSAQSTSLPLSPGFNSVGFPYPVSSTLGTSGLAGATLDADSVYLWNATTQSYDRYTRYDVEGWEWGGHEDKDIPPGTAVFVRKNIGSSTYTSSVPYTWPNN